MSYPNRKSEDSNASSMRWIVAIARNESLPDLRDALRAVEPLSVITSAAATWDGGRDLHYRGATFRGDAPVVRVEIACHERQVDRVLGAIREVFARARPSSGAAQHVMALQYPISSLQTPQPA